MKSLFNSYRNQSASCQRGRGKLADTIEHSHDIAALNRRAFGIALTLLLWAASAHAVVTPTAPAASTAAAPAPPQITIEVSPSVPTPIDNLSATAQLSISSGEWVYGISYIRVTGPKEAPRPIEDVQTSDAKSYLAVVSQASPYTRVVKSNPSANTWLDGLWASVAGVPQPGVVKVEAIVDVYPATTYKDGDQPTLTQTVKAETSVNFANPFWAPLLGIPVGTLLLAAYFAFVAPPANGARPSARLWIGCTVLGVLIWCAAKATNDTPFPLHVDPKNFLGGVLLGFLAWGMRSWVQKIVDPS